MDDKMAFLTQSIMKSKDVMKAVENKAYKKGSIDPSRIIATNENVQQPYFGTPPPQQAPSFNPQNLEKSKMPAEILESFRKNPPMAPQNGQIGLSFLDEIPGNLNPQTAVQENRTVYQQQQPPTFQQPVYSQPAIGMNELQIEGLKSIFEKLIRETMEKVFNEREKLTESAELSENIQIKIGDSIFSGKITGVKSIKK